MRKLSFDGLRIVLAYALYPPTFLFGPLILFPDWCALYSPLSHTSFDMPSNYSGCSSIRVLSYRRMIWRALRLALWFIFWELTVHVVYPNAFVFAMTQPSMGVSSPPLEVLTSKDAFHASPLIETDRSAPGVAVYLLGMQFFFTYLQLYGWPRLLSDLEILIIGDVTSGDSVKCLVPDGPLCFSHTLLFSQIWRLVPM